MRVCDGNRMLSLLYFCCCFAAVADLVACSGGQDSPDLCGNGQLDVGELCDGTHLNGEGCGSIGGAFYAGTLACDPGCDDWDLTQCIASECGNNLRETWELCDGSDLDGNDCTTLNWGFAGGTLACNANCGVWDTTGCTY